MKQDITNWKNLWGEKKSNPVDLETLIGELTKIEKKNKKERIVLLIAFPLTLIILAILLPIFQSKYYLLSIVFIGAGMFMILLQLYKSKLDNSRNEGSFNNQEFIKANIKSLKEKMITTSKYMWIYTVLLLFGLNIGYLEVLNGLNFPARILIHLILTIAILFFMYSGIKKRLLKNKEKILPLIDELENLDR